MDDEFVLRFVPSSAWLIHDEAGRATLSTAAFPAEELEGKRDKSISVLRGMTPPPEIQRRAGSRNLEPGWKSDPVAARAVVQKLRALQDASGRREICVNADPTTDRLGPCPTHASILRSVPPRDPSPRTERAKLRFALTRIFADLAHISGSAVGEPAP